MNKIVMVQYTTRPDASDENQRLVEQVFAQLKQEETSGLRYATFRLADGVTFVHLVVHEIAREDEVNPLTSLSAFAEFQRGSSERTVAAPTFTDATLVGAYRFFGA